MAKYRITVKFKNGNTDSVIVNDATAKIQHLKFLKSPNMLKLITKVSSKKISK